MDGNDDHWERRSGSKAIRSILEKHGRTLLAFHPMKLHFAWRRGRAFLLSSREKACFKRLLRKVPTPLHYPDTYRSSQSILQEGLRGLRSWLKLWSFASYKGHHLSSIYVTIQNFHK